MGELRQKVQKLLRRHRREHKVGNMFDRSFSLGFQGALMIVLEMIGAEEKKR